MPQDLGKGETVLELQHCTVANSEVVGRRCTDRVWGQRLDVEEPLVQVAAQFHLFKLVLSPEDSQAFLDASSASYSSQNCCRENQAEEAAAWDNLLTVVLREII